MCNITFCGFGVSNKFSFAFTFVVSRLPASIDKVSQEMELMIFYLPQVFRFDEEFVREFSFTGAKNS